MFTFTFYKIFLTRICKEFSTIHLWVVLTKKLHYTLLLYFYLKLFITMRENTNVDESATRASIVRFNYAWIKFIQLQYLLITSISAHHFLFSELISCCSFTCVATFYGYFNQRVNFQSYSITNFRLLFFMGEAVEIEIFIKHQNWTGERERKQFSKFIQIMLLCFSDLISYSHYYRKKFYNEHFSSIDVAFCGLDKLCKGREFYIRLFQYQYSQKI